MHSSQLRTYQPLILSAIVAAIIAVSLGGGRAPAPPPRPADPVAPPTQPRDPGAMMQSGASVYVDDSFASVDMLRDAIRYANQGQPQLAINKYQDIVQQFGQKLVFLNDNSYVSITDFVRERLLQMPAVKSGMYDQLFGGTARKAIDDAIDDRDLSALIRAGDRYFPSSAAFKGLSQAAEWYFERGEFSAAARTWRELLTHPMLGKIKDAPGEAEILFRAAAAEGLAQNLPAAKVLRDRLDADFKDATGTISGKEVKLLARLDELLAQPPWEKIDIAGDEWPAYGGGPSHSRLLTTNATIGARLWSIGIAEDAAPAPASASIQDLQRQQQLMQLQLARRGIAIQASDGSGAALTSHPVLSNGSLFIDFGDRILSVSANAGTKLWSYPPEGAPSDHQPAIDPRLRNNLISSMSSHDSVAVFGDQVFAVLPARTSANAVALRLNNPYSLGPTRLVCLNRDSGQELWSRSSDDIKLDKEGSLTFVGSPIVTRQGVYILARKMSDVSFIQQYLVRLDRQSGEVTWTCYLCSTSSGVYLGGSPYLAMSNVILPTLVDDVLYISTGQGADCAVDANVGRILWLRVTHDAKDARSQVPVFLASWKLNPPVIVGDKMIASDSDAALRIYNRWNGALLNTLQSGDYGIARVDVLAGISDNKLIFSGPGDEGSPAQRSVAIEVRSLDDPLPAVAWRKDVPTTSSNGAGKPQGRPFLSANSYYLPFDAALVSINIQSGKADQWAWPPNEKNEPSKPGNLLVTSEQVVVVNDLEVAGYSKWDTARDNRRAYITANPKDPEGYLALAEISFRTGHQDIAQESMKKSVDLANAAGMGGAAAPRDNPGGKSVAEILDRLYRTNLTFAEQLLQKEDHDLRDQSRFYFEQCRATARQPEQQAQWRLRLAELAFAQKKPDEEALLFSEVLADPAIRTASYRDRDGTQSAGGAAEQRLKALIARAPDVYRRFEDQASALNQRSAAAHDLSGLQQVIDSFPNSKAAIAAATTLAGLYQDKQDWAGARRVLWWLVPRLENDPAQARAIANLATASIGLKKYQSASAWAARGDRFFKDFSWTPDSASSQKLTFRDLRAQIVALGGMDVDGRLPLWKPSAPPPNSSEKSPLMDGLPLSPDNQLAAGAQLLVPLEASAALRRPNLAFIRKLASLTIYDTDARANFADGISLPAPTDAVLVGISKDTAVLVQNSAIVGIDLKSKKIAWTHPLRPGSLAAAQQPPNQPGVRQVAIPGNANVTVVAGQVLVNGANYGPVESVILLNQETGERIIPGASSDPEVVRNAAFAQIGQLNFSARIYGGKLFLIASNQLEALDVASGQPAWSDHAGKSLSGAFTDGTPIALIGNEDLVVVQIDSAGSKSSAFLSFDADSGAPRKTLKLDSEHATWRALGDDGTLFLITDQRIAAYDLPSGSSGPLWQRLDIGSHFASAALLSLDSLICVSDSSEVMCLALDSGISPQPRDDSQATSLRLTMPSSTGAFQALRSWMDGETVIFQTSESSSLFFKSRTDTERRLWSLIPPASKPPPFQSLQLCDPYIIELAAGPTSDPRSITKLVFYDRRSGLLKDAKDIVGPAPDVGNRQIRAWQVVDNGILLDLRGTLYFWHTRSN